MAKRSYFEITSSQFKISKIPTGMESTYKNDEEYKKLLLKNQVEIEEFQTLLYAGHRKGLLIIFQGMDSSGKDGAIKHVMAGVNPQGCSVTSFKTPTQTELDHDFLWRSNQNLPEKGEIKIFNRSYYEEVLITKVHPELLESEHLPAQKINKEFWLKRYSDIVHHENYLYRQGLEIIKIFIHISKATQKERLLLRFQDPKKHWKINKSDVRERQYWSEYQKAYEACIRETSTQACPWYVVPGDNKKNARLSIAQILTMRFEKLNLSYPKLNKTEIKNLKKMQSVLKAR